eukprot:2847857-Rhodomonas_salina.1
MCSVSGLTCALFRAEQAVAGHVRHRGSRAPPLSRGSAAPYQLPLSSYAVSSTGHGYRLAPCGYAHAQYRPMHLLRHFRYQLGATYHPTHLLPHVQCQPRATCITLRVSYNMSGSNLGTLYHATRLLRIVWYQPRGRGT